MKKRDLICESLSSFGLQVKKPEGAFYAPARADFYEPQKFLEDLYHDHGIVVYNGSWFGMNGYLRFSFSSTLENIGKGLERISKAIKDIKK